MKLPIKKKYFDQIKSGEKDVDWRDAHITFVCEETGETLTRKITDLIVMPTSILPPALKDSGMFDDDTVIGFCISDTAKKRLLYSGG